MTRSSTESGFDRITGDGPDAMHHKSHGQAASIPEVTTSDAENTKWTPEGGRKLASEIILGALKDLQARDPAIREAAWRWLLTDDEGPMTVTWACHKLDLSLKAVREEASRRRLFPGQIDGDEEKLTYRRSSDYHGAFSRLDEADDGHVWKDPLADYDPS